MKMEAKLHTREIVSTEQACCAGCAFHSGKSDAWNAETLFYLKLRADSRTVLGGERWGLRRGPLFCNSNLLGLLAR